MANTTILVPLDGSQFAEASVPAAMAMARRLGADIELVSVFEDASVLAEARDTGQEFKAWLHESLEELATRIRDVSEIPVATTIVDGLPSERLVEYAKRSSVEMIVMATHGRGPVSRAWLGSVADYVLRHVDVPVLLVRAEEGAEPTKVQEWTFHHALVALDGSDRAEHALDWAVDLAMPGETTITLFRAVEPPIPFASPYLPQAVDDTQAALEAGRGAAVDYLSQVSDRLGAQGHKVETQAVVGVHPAPGIVDYADRHPVDLIVIGTHGHRGLRRLVLGSVADKVLRSANVPILLVRDAKRKANPLKVVRGSATHASPAG
jgi:nucleotide-binding universal stress UspA family protein